MNIQSDNNRLYHQSQTSFLTERDRTKVPEQHTWNLRDLYKSDEEWKHEKSDLTKRLSTIAQFSGKISNSPQQLFTCLEEVNDISKEFMKLYVYAGCSSDQNTRDSKYLAMQQEMGQVGSQFASATAFLEPEILSMDASAVDSFLRQEQKLATYAHYLKDVLRRKAHMGTEGEERIIADAGLMADAPESIFSVFSDADFPSAEVTLHDGNTVKLDRSAFSLYRTVPHREDRKNVCAAFFTRLNEYRRTFGTQLNSQMKRDLFYMRARKYSSCLEAALDGNNIPVEVYHTLVKNANDNLPTFHRYLNLRKRILGVDELHYYDMYAPLLGEIELRYSIEEAQTHVLASLNPLGDEYKGLAKKSFENRWIDFYPTEGKRSGAYSNGAAYGVHPYMLLNYNGKYDDVSTLTHELGHALHSFYSNKYQHYANCHYSIFVAEVASTFNEALLIDYMLKNTADDKIKLSLLGYYLEGIKATVFRQIQFAEFELKIHEIVEQGEAITGDRLNELYYDMVKRYYGHDAGVCIADEYTAAEWAYIPHFYYNFYVYQYATSFTASAALSERVLAGDTATTKRYIELLSSGGSDYPINLLKKAGVDMTTSEPFALTMTKMNRVMDEMEGVLKRIKSS